MRIQLLDNYIEYRFNIFPVRLNNFMFILDTIVIRQADLACTILYRFWGFPISLAINQAMQYSPTIYLDSYFEERGAFLSEIC